MMCVCGLARPDSAWPGRARHGVAVEARLGVARQGTAWLGKA